MKTYLTIVIASLLAACANTPLPADPKPTRADKNRSICPLAKDGCDARPGTIFVPSEQRPRVPR